MAGFVFRDLDEALAVFQLGPARFRCWVCGRTHRSGSKAAEACAARVKEAPALLVGLDAADLDDAGIRSETAAEVCAPWLRLAPPLGLPISWDWGPEDEQVIVASLALPAGRARAALERFYRPAVAKWLEWALPEAERRKARRREALNWLDEVFSDVPRFFAFEVVRGDHDEIMVVKVEPRDGVSVPEGVQPLRLTTGPYWMGRMAAALGERYAQHTLWEFRYLPGGLHLLVSRGVRQRRWWYEVRYDAENRACRVRLAEGA